MVPAWLSFFDGLMALALVAAGIVGAHFYMVDPFLGFQLFILGLLVGALGFVIGLIAIWRTAAPERRIGRTRALVGTILGLAVVAPVLVLFFTIHAPPINDITTDFDNPPEFAQIVTASDHPKDMSYDKAHFAQAQLAGYGALGPLKLPRPPDKVYEQVKAAAAAMPDWKITFTDPANKFIQGVATTKLFHFHDDFAIQVRPAPGGGSLVEMRSKSRVGQGDLGANYKRIKDFFAVLSRDSGVSGAPS